MKTKIFRSTCYLLFILLSLNSCVNEMDMIESEQNLETSIGRSYPADTWTKYLIDYDKSTKDKNALAKVENLLASLYRSIPDLEFVIDNLVMRGLKVRITVNDVPGGSKESWFDSSYPPEIGFNGYSNITMGRMLHELLHMFSFNTYDSYRRGVDLACEEYEIRVLTDLYMRRYFRSDRHDYQGMHPQNTSYRDYLTWLDEIINDTNYNLNSFALKFKQYGVYCMEPLEDEKIKIQDFTHYRPLLVSTLWFYKAN